jgi:hypothetical protein
MLNIRIALLLTLLVMLAFTPVIAATLRVEVDGTSPVYYGIQDAVDAAAAGDTILIGPGRYDTFVDVVAPAWTEPTIVWVTKDNLTFIGSGVGETILGPTEYYDPVGLEPKGMICIDDFIVVVQDLTIENLRTGFWWTYGSFEMIDCSMENCHGGIISTNSGGAIISGSFFSNFVDSGYGVGCWAPARDIFVSNCRFEATWARGVMFNGVEHGEIESCFFESWHGVQVVGGIATQISNCVMSSAVTVGISVYNTSVDLQSNEIFGIYDALSLSSMALVTGANNIFSGGNNVWGTIRISGNGSQVSLQGNHIFKTDDFAVKIVSFMDEFVEQDLTNNYWGTTDPDEIAEWIWDGNDDSTIHSVVNFSPIADGQVSSEAVEWDSLKAMFRGGRK